jgi:hypothetical protein
MNFVTKDFPFNRCQYMVQFAGPIGELVNNIDKIEQWINQNIKSKDCWTTGATWYFRNDADRTMFILRWS